MTAAIKDEDFEFSVEAAKMLEPDEIWENRDKWEQEQKKAKETWDKMSETAREALIGRVYRDWETYHQSPSSL